MRRAVSVLSIGALVAALWSGIASAAMTPGLDTPLSLSHELFHRCFGFADRLPGAPDSPLGAFALRVQAPQIALAAPPQIDFAALPLSQLASMAERTLPTPGALGDYQAPVVRPAATTATLAPEEPPQPTIGYYRDPQPVPTIAPSSYPFDLPSRDGRTAVSFSPVLTPTSGFTASSVGADSQGALPQLGGAVSLPVRLGHVHLQTHADAGEARSDALAYDDTAMGGGATFDARLGKWKQLGVDVSSHYEHLTVDAPVFSGSSLDGTSNLDLTNDHLPVFVPAYADISKHTISAGLAVPVSRRMIASVQVDAQHLLGGYGTPGLSNLDANNMIYGARLTYQLKGASAISLSAKQYRYQDNLIPANAFTQTSANLNFTVKF